jgi:hypothetical protein
MARPFIKTVTSNLKSPDGDSWTMELAQRTLIVGSNASHKSSVLQACELALTGAVDDVVWRSVVRDAALLITMAPGNTLNSKVTLSNGAVHQFNVEAGKRPPGANFDNGVLPIRQVRAAIAGSPATARKIFLPWLAGELTDADLLAHIPAKLHTKFKDLLQHMSRGSKAEALLAIEEYAAKSQRDASKEAKGAQSIIDELTAQMEEAPSEEALAAAEVRLHDLLAAKPVPVESEEVLEARLIATRHRHNAAQEAASKLEFEYSAETILTSAMTHTLDQCPVCSSQVGTPHLQACLDHYVGLNRILEDEHKLTYLEAVDAMMITRREMSQCEDLLHADLSPTVSTEDIEKAQAEYDDLKTAQVKWDTLTAAKRRIDQYDEDVETYKQLKAACSSAIAAIVKERSASFCTIVSSFLPKGWEFALKVDAKTFRAGLSRDGEIHSALCGAEGAAVITAIAMATTVSRPKADPIVLIPEDRAFDPRTLAQVMRGYNKFDGQVIMASTVRPRGRPSKHWTIIDLDAEPLADVVEAAPEPETATPEPESELESSPKVIRRPRNVVTGDRNLRILKGFGFNEDTIARMNVECALEIIKAGHLASNTEIKSDGSFEIVSGGNVLTIPKLPAPPQ